MSVQEITLLVPIEYDVPKIFHAVDAEGTAQILTLGAQAYDILVKEGQRKNNDSLFQQLKDQASQEFKVQTEAADKVLARLKERADALETRLQEEQEHRRSTEQRVREEERRNRDEIMKEKESRIFTLEDQVRQLNASIRESGKQVTDQLQTFKEQILKTTTGSKKKGDLGEFIFDDILRRAFGNVPAGERFDIMNVGREGHQGDIRMHWIGHNFMWEIKNYDRNIDKKEVTKFVRDFEESGDLPIGFFVSLNTGITDHIKAGNVDIEMQRDGRLLVYISNLLHMEDPVGLLQSLKPFCEVFVRNYESRRAEVKEEDDDTKAARQVQRFEQQRQIIVKLLKAHADQVKDFKNTIMNAKKKAEQHWTEILADMNECTHRVKMILETILEATIEDSPEDALAADEVQKVDIPSYIFRHADLSLYSDKERKFMLDTLRIFEFNEDYKISTKDLKDLYKQNGYAEDVVTAMRPRIFTEDAWDKGKKEVKYLRKKAV